MANDMSERDYFLKGLHGRRNGKSKEDNPFSSEEEEEKYTHWLNGWLIGNYKINSEASSLTENGT